MTRSMKAALLSACIFPGLGHLYLRKYLPGSALLAVSLLAIGYPVVMTTKMAVQISEGIRDGSVSPDVATITAVVERQAAGGDVQMMNLALLVLVFCWLVGALDAYRVGRRQ